MYKDYDVKIKLVQEQWIQLKMTFLLGHYLGFPTGVENMGVLCPSPPWWGSSKLDGQGFNQYMGGAWGEALNAVKKYLWRSWFDSNVVSYKPPSLQIY